MLVVPSWLRLKLTLIFCLIWVGLRLIAQLASFMDSELNSDCMCIIRDVWASNLEEEVSILRDLIETHPFVSMDTEFPGVVARPIGNFKTSSDYHYQTLRCNVDLLKIIQLGITLSNEKGSLPKQVCTWQFNFKFDLTNDLYAQDSIDLLSKAGIEFKKHEHQGIDVEEFAELMITSGMVLLRNVKWISFHSGYDFGYLLKLLTSCALPSSESEFFGLLNLFFPCIYDIKYLMKSCKNLKGGLQDVADDLGVERIGPQHQAGSDSLLTARTFFQMRNIFFDDKIDDLKYLGHLYGLSPPNTSASDAANQNSNHVGSVNSITSTATANEIAITTIASSNHSAQPSMISTN